MLFLKGLTISILVLSSQALRAVPFGPCASLCGNTSDTTSDEIVCSDTDYQGTAAGQTAQACISCQLNSTAVDTATNTSDLQWALYNIRYTASSCLWGFPDNSHARSSPCITGPACGNIESNIQYQNLSSNASAYGYCANFANMNAQQCSVCLEQYGDDAYMANFFIILEAACSQQPVNGHVLSISGSPFETTAITIQTDNTSNGSTSSAQSLSGGAKAGIAIGVIAVVLIIVGLSIVYWGKRRSHRRLEDQRFRQEAFTRATYANSTPMQKSYNNHEAFLGQSRTFGAHEQVKWAVNPEYVVDGVNTFSPYQSPVSARDMVNPKTTWDWKRPTGSVAPAEADHSIRFS